MPFSPAVLAELHTELERLQRQRLHIDERIEALRRILGQEKPIPDLLATDREVVNEVEKVPPSQPTVKAVVLSALNERPGVKAGVLTKLLRQRGFKTNGPTRLSHRVYNELWRMARDGEIIKTADGRFIPKERTAP